MQKPKVSLLCFASRAFGYRYLACNLGARFVYLCSNQNLAMAPRAAFALTSRQNGSAASQTQCWRRLAECEGALAEAQSILQVTQSALYQSNNEVAKLQAALSNSEVLIRDLRLCNAVNHRDLSVCQSRLRQRTQRAAEAEAVLGDYVKALVACQTKVSTEHQGPTEDSICSVQYF